MESIFKSFFERWSHLYLDFECSANHMDDLGCFDRFECFDKNKYISVEELEQFSASFYSLHEHMVQQINDFEGEKKSLENNYKKILEEIKHLRMAITDSLDELEKNTIKKLDTLQDTMRRYIQDDIYHFTDSIEKMTCLQKELRRIRKYHHFKGNDKRSHVETYRECLEYSLKTEAVLKEMKARNEVTLTFNPDTLIQQTMSTLSGLGQILQNGKQSQTVGSITQDTVTRPSEPDDHDLFFLDDFNPIFSNVRVPIHPRIKKKQLRKKNWVMEDKNANSVIKLEKSKMFRVRMTNDSHTCLITGICETVAGLLITDSKNKNMKLLDQDYKVEAHCHLPGIPESMCSIDSSLVAVTVCNSEVHFIRVTNGQLVHEDRTIKPQHFCKGIAHHQGNLYITSGTALYKYTTNGRQVCKIYEEKSCYSAVTSCVITTGKGRIYVANHDCSKLLTLSRDGKVISTLADPALKLPYTYGHNPLHVTGSGQVLVCNADFNTVLQVDKDGKDILAEVVAGKDGLRTPLCVYYRKHTGKLVLGMMDNDNIMVLSK